MFEKKIRNSLLAIISRDSCPPGSPHSGTTMAQAFQDLARVLAIMALKDDEPEK